MEDKPSKSINDYLEKHGLRECQVVLGGVLADGPTAEYNMLNGNPEKTYSVPSQWPSGSKYLDSLIKKDPIAWHKMSKEDDLIQLDNLVSTLLVGAPSIFTFLNSPKEKEMPAWS